MEKQINKKKSLGSQSFFYVIISLKYSPVRFGIFFILCHIKINKMTSYSQSKNGCNTQHCYRIRSENQRENQGSQIECRLDTVVTFRIAKIVFIIGPICQDSSLEEANSDIKEADCSEKISLRIQKKTHRNCYQHKPNENRIVTINQKQSLLTGASINSMVKFTKIKQEQRKHDNEIQNRINREILGCKEANQPNNHLSKRNNDKKGDALD